MIELDEEQKREMLANLRAGQGKSYIAFKFPFGVLNKPTIVVSDITSIFDDTITCHFMMGVRSDSYNFQRQDVLAIGDMEKGDVKFCGWSGKFLVLRPEFIQKISGSKEWDLIEEIEN